MLVHANVFSWEQAMLHNKNVIIYSSLFKTSRCRLSRVLSFHATVWKFKIFLLLIFPVKSFLMDLKKKTCKQILSWRTISSEKRFVYFTPSLPWCYFCILVINTLRLHYLLKWIKLLFLEVILKSCINGEERKFNEINVSSLNVLLNAKTSK